jgi:hypothetical protein
MALRWPASSRAWPGWCEFWVTLNQIYHKSGLVQAKVVKTIKSPFGCSQSRARAAALRFPFWIDGGSWAQRRCQIRLGANAPSHQFRCIIAHSWSGGRLFAAKNGLMDLRANGGEQAVRKGAHIPFRLCMALITMRTNTHKIRAASLIPRTVARAPPDQSLHQSTHRASTGRVGCSCCSAGRRMGLGRSEGKPRPA